MSTVNKRKISQLETDYALQHVEGQISVARQKKVLYRRLVAFFVLATVATFFMVSTMISQNSAMEKKAEEKKLLKAELTALQKDEVILKEEIVKLNDDEYIAKLARKEFFYSDDNEIIFALPENEKEGQE